MTWITTHLALEGLVAFVLIGTTLRSKFFADNTSKMMFFLANIIAIVPDLDVYLNPILGTAVHRGFTHSLTFPLIFIILGYFFYFLVRYFRESGAEISNTIELLPYFFFLAGFFWGTHLLLDIDANEGPMMLLWPLDDRLYEIKLSFLLDAFPFLFLPWTPLQLVIEVDQSTIRALSSYLLNWTPADFQNYFGSTQFYFSFQSLILHMFIFLVYIHVVLRKFLSFEFKSNKTPNLFSKFYLVWFSVKKYWKQVPKQYFAPGLMIAIIGFTMGPVITEQVADNQSNNGSLKFTPQEFSPLFQIGFETVAQVLDPNANQVLNYSFKLSSSESDFSIMLVIAKSDWFSTMRNSIQSIANKYIDNETIISDLEFKQEYQSSVLAVLSNNQPIISKTLNETDVNTTLGDLYITTEKAFFGIGFLLLEWTSAPLWNETDFSVSISLNLETSYDRQVNYTLGLTIQVIGLFLVLLSILKPFYKD